MLTSSPAHSEAHLHTHCAERSFALQIDRHLHSSHTTCLLDAVCVCCACVCVCVVLLCRCEDVQLISKYCERKGIQHQGIGPVIFVRRAHTHTRDKGLRRHSALFAFSLSPSHSHFSLVFACDLCFFQYEGFTSEVIDGKAGSIDARRAKIAQAVNSIAEGKKWVLVDGVGYAAVGSVAGVSNAEVASLLNAPVLVVGRPGIGNAIDSMNFILAYFAQHKVHCIGACWNKLPARSTYHSYESCKAYVNKYFKEVKPGVISTYGHIPLVETKVAMTHKRRVHCKAHTACVLLVLCLTGFLSLPFVSLLLCVSVCTERLRFLLLFLWLRDFASS